MEGRIEPLEDGMEGTGGGTELRAGGAELRGVAAGDPEIIIARDGCSEIAAHAFAVIVPVIRGALKRAEHVGRICGRAGRDVGDVGAGNIGPDFANHRAAGVQHGQVQDRGARANEITGRDGNLKIPGESGDAGNQAVG